MNVPRCGRCERMMGPDERACGGCGAPVRGRDLAGRKLRRLVVLIVALVVPLGLSLAAGAKPSTSIICFAIGAAVAASIFLAAGKD
jgi:hypothetical protein